MSENKKNTWLPIIGGIALIVVLFIIIKLIFAGLEKVIPKQVPKDSSQPPAQSQTVEDGFSAGQGGATDTQAPSFCIYCGKALPESFEWGQYCPYCGERMEE